MVDIWDAEGDGDLDICKYEDDLDALLFPNEAGPFDLDTFLYSHDRDTCLALIEALNIPWHPTKTGKSFRYSMVFIGFYWDLINRRVSLPEIKRLKFLARVDKMITAAHASKKFSLRDIQEIHGSLVHICFVFSEGSSHLPPISNFMSTFRTEAHRFLPDSVIHTLKWWHRRLCDPLAFRQLYPLGPVQDMGVFVDASTSWGIGIIIGELWYAFPLKDDWKVEGVDICWLEAVALEFLIYFLVQMGFSDAHLLIHSDNKGAIGAHLKGRSGNIAINLCVRRSCATAADHRIVPNIVYIESKLNPSDPISRGILGDPPFMLTRQFDIPHDLLYAFSDIDVR
jgi:hypothetical protein